MKCESLREIVRRRSATSFALNYQLGRRTILPFPAAERQIMQMHSGDVISTVGELATRFSLQERSRILAVEI